MRGSRQRGRASARTNGAVALTSGPTFTPLHRGGSGPPLVCLHGFLDTWRTWELVLPALERSHDVLAPTLAGHAGGPSIVGELHTGVLADAVERAMDAAGFRTAHLVGNSLGGYLAFQLAIRGRAESVVALAPAGGWGPDDAALDEALSLQEALVEQLPTLVPHVDEILATRDGRRRATQFLVSRFEHIPAELMAHLMLGAAACPSARSLLELARRADWSLEAERIACPVRVLWGTDDLVLPWPASADRFREGRLPHADWVILDGVGHCPQLDVPLEAAQLILGFSAG
ncbi:MAG TPA: alpha/beta fold hydrolase [Gaiellaceae bacterium]